jgi:hypothetical protein
MIKSVRSSIPRRLGVDIGALAPVDRHIEGVVEMVLDATANCHAPMSRKRLFGWHAARFPTGYSGLSRINVGHWRDDASGPMQVVSGHIGRQTVHFEAPPADHLAFETSRFLDWVNGEPRTNHRCSRSASATCGSLRYIRSTTATVVSHEPSATRCWHVLTAARNASTRHSASLTRNWHIKRHSGRRAV